MSIASIASPATVKIVGGVVVGVILAGLLLGWGYSNNTPVLSDAAKGFK